MNFSSENTERLTKVTDDLGETLIKSGFGFYVDQLSQIRLAAERHDIEEFKNQIINRGLFGGTGAMWEIWIENKQLRRAFQRQFRQFMDLIKEMGITNERVNQVREGFDFMDKD
jgi:hypothetical protein